MTNAEIAKITAAVIAALGVAKPKKNYGTVAKKKAYAPKNTVAVLEPKADRQMKRLALIGKGFERRGITVTFDKNTGKFDNVKPYKVWVLEGRRVRRGEHGVQGLFHISQTDVDVAPALPSTEGVIVTKLPITAPELGAKVPAKLGSLSELSVLIPA